MAVISPFLLVNLVGQEDQAFHLVPVWKKKCNVAPFNLGKVRLRANADSGLVLKRAWSVGWPKGPLLILWLTLHLMLAFWADLCGSGVKANLSGFWLPALPFRFLVLCVGNYKVRWVFSTEFPSVWRCQLVAARRGSSRSQGCLGYLLAMPEALWLPSNL